ncbi:MAG: ribosome small subunit-dependent GTPase A [Anaerolineales bacterium]|nr:ribosome small subunit-dependent GTPase A [Anaerolineales bacterium]
MLLLRGLVIRSQSGFYTVATPQGALFCRLRGRLKKGPRSGSLIAIGDWVEVTPLNGGAGVIEAIEPRQRMLSRMAPTPKGAYQQIIIANPDQAVFVFACARPAPRFGMLDRFLVIAERQQIPALVVANKTDLVSRKEARAAFAHYPALGYPVLFTSAKTGAGVAALRRQMKGKVSLFAGPSGAGKSSLLSRLLPQVEFRVDEVSQATNKGKHTTVVKELFALPEGGYLADTPGLKALALWDIQPAELDGYFPELRLLVKDCQFNDCTHLHEPGCAVLAALEEGRLHPRRYISYASMRLGQEEEG